MKKKNYSFILKSIIFLPIGFLSIWWFWDRLTPEEKSQIFISIKEANYLWIVLAMLVGLISHYLRALRWNMLIKPLGHKPKTIDTFAAVSIGYLGNFIIPRFGELLRCATLSKSSKASFSSLFGTVVVERILDMIVFLVIFLIGLSIFIKQLSDYASGFLYKFLSSFTPEKIIFLIALGVLALIVVWLIYIYKDKLNKYRIFEKLISLLSKFKNGLLSSTKIKNWPLFVFYSIFIWICYFLMTYLCFFAIEETFHLPISAAFAALAFGTIGIIVVQGGIGIFPAIIAETLLLFSVASAFGYAMGWLMWFAQTFLLMAMGLWAAIYLIFKKKFTISDIKTDTTENII